MKANIPVVETSFMLTLKTSNVMWVNMNVDLVLVFC